MDDVFSHQSRQIFAGILNVLQENLTKNHGKRTKQTDVQRL